MRARIVAFAAAAVCAVAFPNAASAGPSLSVSPSSLAFGQGCVGAPSAASTVTVTNNGDSDVHVSSISVTGDAASDYGLSGAQARTIAPGGHATFQVTFTPASTGDRNAAVQISSDAQAQSVPLSGAGVTRTLEVNPTQLAFGDQRTGSASDPLSLSLASVGSAAVTINRVYANGTNAADFSVGAPSRKTLNPGADASVAVLFRPRGNGTRTGAVVIDSNACAGRTAIAVNGTGTVPKINVKPSPVDGGVVVAGGNGDPIPVVVGNVGRAPLRITDIAVEGAQASDFRFDSFPDLPKVLGPGEQFLVNVTFHPEQPGPAKALLRITSDDPAAGSFVVELLGNQSGSPGASPAGSPSPDATQVTESIGGSAPPHAVGARGTTPPGGAGDWISIGVVMAGVGGIFAGLFAIRRRRVLTP